MAKIHFAKEDNIICMKCKTINPQQRENKVAKFFYQDKTPKPLENSAPPPQLKVCGGAALSFLNAATKKLTSINCHHQKY